MNFRNLFWLFLASVFFVRHNKLFAQTPSAPPPKSPVHFESDTLEYQEVEQVIIASGNVKVRQSSYTFFSDHAIFNILKKDMAAWGHVRFSDDKGNEIRARSLSYSTEFGSAELIETEGSFGPWIFGAKKVFRDQNGNFFLDRAKLSTCETDLSKYHLYGHRIKIMPQKRLTVQHALFRVGPVPILYLPYYYYSLGEKHLAFQIFPGRNQSEGAFVRTVWGYPTTDETYLRFYLDHLSNRGTGTGGEMNYYFTDRMKGNLYGLTIRDRLSDRMRWNTRLFHWQRFSPSWVLQVNGNRLSDDTFPNDFFREDFNRVVRDFKSWVAFTYQKQSIYFRVVGERHDQFDPVNREFFAGQLLAPRIEFSQVQTPLGALGLEKILSFNLANRFAGKSFAGTDLPRQYRRESDFQFSLLRQIGLGRGTNLVPKVTFKNQWKDIPHAGEISEPHVQRVELESVLRRRFGYFLDIDLSYILSDRLQDNGGEDRGWEKHSLSFFSLTRPRDWFSFRFETAHNLPRNKGESLAFQERKNYQPLKGELTVSPGRDLEIFFREEYTLADALTGSAHPLSTQGEIVWGQRARGGNYLGLATSYSSGRENTLELRHTSGYSPSERWRFEGTLRSLIFYRNLNLLNVSSGDLVEKELLVRREWRCWELSFSFKERAGVSEFFFNLELKLERADREKTSPTQRESEWYPWRGWK